MNKPLFLVAGLLIIVAARAQVGNYAASPKEQHKDTLLLIQKLINTGITKGIKDTGYSLGTLRQAAAEAKKMQNDILEAKSFSAIGDIYFQLRIYNRALPNYSRSADMYYETPDHLDYAYAMLGLAKSQYYRGNYTRAAASFTEAIKISEHYGLPEIAGESNEYLGLIYGAFQNLKRNTEAYRKSLEIKESLHDDMGSIRVARNLSQIYYESEKFDSALIFANLSFTLAKKLNLPTDMYMAQFTKTASLIRLKRMEDAKYALTFFQQDKTPFQDANLRLRYQTVLGNYYLAKNDEPQSGIHYDSALNIIRQNSFPELLIIVYGNMAGSYLVKGDIHKAYDYYKKYNEQLSFFYSGDNLTKLANLEGLVFLDASKDEIKRLNDENKLKALLLAHEQMLKKNLSLENLLKDSMINKEKLLNEAQQEKLVSEKNLSNAVIRQNELQVGKLNDEKQLRIYLLSGIGLFTTLGTVIYFMYKRQRKKSAIIQKQADELQTLMKEIHHRVKNNLQVISSLLDLQSLSIKDRHASGAVKEGKLRVQSMALIHQNLYNDGNIKGIIMDDYIKNLVENLFNSYNIQQNKIQLVTDIDHLNLDVDTVIPLGLIINELINNSLKYAFTEKKEGKIYVSLKEYNKQLELHVNDNGCGFPPTWNSLQNNSFGYKLVRAFAQKLKAKIEIYNDNGACVSMNISRYKLA